MIKKVFPAFFIVLLSLSHAYGESLPLYAYRDYGVTPMQKMEILGQVTSKSHMISMNRPRLLDYDTREMTLTAKLYENQGIRIGDTIYIIEKDPDHRKYLNGLIVGKATVFSIFKTEFQGWMLKARGNLSMIKKGHFIARMDFGSQRNKALEYLKQGDKFQVLGDYAKAYLWYKKSLDMDKNRPETYIKLTQLSLAEGMMEQAITYVDQAWQRRAKIEDPNDMLSFPGLYLGLKLGRVKKVENIRVRFKELLSLLRQVREYKSQINMIGNYVQPEYRSMLEKAGIPEYSYQFNLGNLFQEIYKVMTDHKVNEIIEWMETDEREILFEPLFLAYQEDPFEYPKKSWNMAFFEAALYHYKMAGELDALDTRASYEIIMMSYDRLKGRPSMKETERFKNLIAHYGRQYLRVPEATDRYSRVQNVLNNFNQF